MTPQVEALKPVVLQVLRDAETKMTQREIAAACGSTEVWTVKACIYLLRHEGHDIKAIPGGGYWLMEKGPPPKNVPRTPESSFARLRVIDRTRWHSIDRIKYPLDMATLHSLLKERDVSLTAVLREAKKYDPRMPDPYSGYNSFLSCRAIKAGSSVDKKYGYKGGVYPRREATWWRIWAIARALGVPPEILVDEMAFLYRGIPDVVPVRFAGYRLLFGVVREGLHPLDAVPPDWLARKGLTLEEFKADPYKQRHALTYMFHIYKGDLYQLRYVDSFLYVCTRARVSPAELFVGNKGVRTLPLQSAHTDIARLPEWDVLFLAAVARLLGKLDRRADDATLISELALLVKERRGWRDKIEEKTRKRGSIQTQPDS